MVRRRKGDTFGLSFLDCICCGFGAVILFYTVIAAQSGGERGRQLQSLTGEVNRLDEKVETGTRNLVVLMNSLEEVRSETASAAGRSARIIEELQSKREQLSTYQATSLAQREKIEKLKSDIKALEAGARRLEAGSADRAPPGQATKAFRSTGGQREYISGIRMRGKHILMLVDRSASMLHEDLVSILVLRNSSENKKRKAAKWRRTVDVVSWLVTQLPAGGEYQIYTYNTRAEALLPESAGRWHSAADVKVLAGNLNALRELTPEGGTSLVNAFSASKGLNPRPDQIVLITDGLPTQGANPPNRKFVSAGARVRLFDESLGALPDGVPIDIVLMQLKGEPLAAHRFWQLAHITGGLLLMPSKDWP